MKTNLFLLAVLMVIAGLWASGQIWWADSAYSYHPTGQELYGRVVYAGQIKGWLTPNCLLFLWVPASPNSGGFDAGHFSFWRSESRRGPFCAPSWDVQHSPDPRITLAAPFWLLVLLPAVPLAWRLWRRRKKDTRGFTVATA